MYISEIINLSVEDEEAEVYVSDGEYLIKCYMYPARKVTLNQKVNYICGYMCEDIKRSYEMKYSIRKTSGHYAYSIIARVMDKKKRTVCVGDLFIELDEAVPEDIMEEEYISFNVTRLDCL